MTFSTERRRGSGDNASARKTHVTTVLGAKPVETRARRIAKIVDGLKG